MQEQQDVLAVGRRATVEMDTDKSWMRFTREATFVRALPAPGGSLLLLRLFRPVWYWHPLPRKAKYLGVGTERPYYRMVNGRATPVTTHLYVEVFGIRGVEPENPRRKWSQLEIRLQPRNLVEFGMATVTLV